MDPKISSQHKKCHIFEISIKRLNQQNLNEISMMTQSKVMMTNVQFLKWTTDSYQYGYQIKEISKTNSIEKELNVYLQQFKSY